MCSVRLELSVFLLLCDFHIIPPTNSLGNHTVNRLYSFGVVFVDFDKEYLKIQDFRQNISNPARSSAFFMYTFFLNLKTRHLGEILDLLSKMTSKREVIRGKGSIQTHNVCIMMFSTSLFDSKSKISPR